MGAAGISSLFLMKTGTLFSHRLLDKYLDYLLSAGPARRQQRRPWRRCEGL